MIVRSGQVESHRKDDGTETLHLSDAGGLRQFGAYHQTLPLGTRSSQRHWHTCEDEFLYVLAGAASIIDDAGTHLLGPGDAACWQHGDANGHHVHNLSDAPLAYLIVGTRVAQDICHYPDDGSRQINADTTWQLQSADGQTLRHGDLPPELLNLRPRWGHSYDSAKPYPRIIRPAMVQTDQSSPGQQAHLGAYDALLYSNTAGLSQFGAFVETLHPGARSSDRHWHEQEDEFLYMLSGEATVLEDDGAHLIRPGDAACWPAAVANGHHVFNPSTTLCSYLIVGTRLPSDIVHYSEIDKLYIRENGVARRTRRDGSPI